MEPRCARRTTVRCEDGPQHQTRSEISANRTIPKGRDRAATRFARRRGRSARSGWRSTSFGRPAGAALGAPNNWLRLPGPCDRARRARTRRGGIAVIAWLQATHPVLGAHPRLPIAISTGGREGRTRSGRARPATPQSMGSEGALRPSRDSRGRRALVGLEKSQQACAPSLAIVRSTKPNPTRGAPSTRLPPPGGVVTLGSWGTRLSPFRRPH
jgi:hypothetical protein